MPISVNRASTNSTPGRKWILYLFFGIMLVMLSVSLIGCGTEPVAKYDDETYNRDKNLKDEVKDLMTSLATDYESLQELALQVELKDSPELQDFESVLDLKNLENRQAWMNELEKKLNEAKEAEGKRENNGITIEIWKKIMDPDGKFLGGFIKSWRNDASLLAEFFRMKENSTILDKIAEKLKNWREKKILSADNIRESRGNLDNPGDKTILWAFQQLINWEEYKKDDNKEKREQLLKEWEKLGLTDDQKAVKFLNGN